MLRSGFLIRGGLDGVVVEVENGFGVCDGVCDLGVVGGGGVDCG